MKDLVVILMITAFFALCLAYVHWCDRIIGPDPVDAVDEVADDDTRVDEAVPS